MKIASKWHVKNQKDQIKWKWNQYKMEKSETKTSQIKMK